MWSGCPGFGRRGRAGNAAGTRVGFGGAAGAESNAAGAG